MQKHYVTQKVVKRSLEVSVFYHFVMLNIGEAFLIDGNEQEILR